ncbi:glycosyltransferase [Desulforhopalus sp. IMCC35007]|uniref:glycosyltransferase n=1 Tax=Desulforhopalus sp. IMCC35007 TaxID=2569543 RepID=UPI0010AE16FD|nr:glycosyltransferase family 2 protein [Desulforhopalus sp. IMCC35007]TKB09327.1 glycosyltransferase family 2 protein [Desulforhopalus sp. IMCC35007]
MPVHVIIVTHNSEREIPLCLDALLSQKHPADSITIVDSGSADTSYLAGLENMVTSLIRTTNIGFSRANNLGFRSLTVENDDIVIFLNPDTFLNPDAIVKIVEILTRDRSVGCVTGKLLGFDLGRGKPTGLLDSSGIFRKWYGRWYDRGQGEEDRGQYDFPQVVPAVCGALLCCRIETVEVFAGDIFDPAFFLYKEDIELSLRLRKSGWKLFYSPEIVAYHCRGWKEDRQDVSYEKRLYSAENEIKMYIRHPSVYLLWAGAKYLAVRLFRM